MKKTHSKLRKILPLALGLAVGGAGISSVNADNLDYSFWDRTADFMFNMSYVNKPINRNEETNLKKLIRGGKDETFYATSPIEAFRSRIAYLNSAEGKKKYPNPALRNLYIERFKDFINYCERNNIKPSKKSLEKLSSAAKDGILEPREFDGVEDNLYAIVGKGGDPYEVPYLVPIVSEKTPKQYQEKINELENKIRQLGQTPVQPQQIAPQPEQVPEARGQETPEPSKVLEEQKETDYRSFYFLAQQIANTDFNSYITSLGARWNPFKKADIGFEATLDLGFGLDKQTDSYTAPLVSRRTAYGTKTDAGKFSAGGSLGMQIGPFFMDWGLDYKIWTQNILEQILDSSGNVLKSNINSILNRQVFSKFSGGVEVPIGNFKLGAVAGYNSRDNFSFGLRGGYKIK